MHLFWLQGLGSGYYGGSPTMGDIGAGGYGECRAGVTYDKMSLYVQGVGAEQG